VDHAAVLHCLLEKLGFKSDCFQWVPHLLTCELRAKRKELTGLMIPYLEAARKDGWRHLVTGDESWCFLRSGSRRTWALAKDEAATKNRTDIHSKKPCVQSCGIHTDSMPSIGSRLVPNSTTHIIPLISFSRSIRSSFRKGEIRMASNWLCTSTAARFTGV
jgi:hypothetical protein